MILFFPKNQQNVITNHLSISLDLRESLQTILNKREGGSSTCNTKTHGGHSCCNKNFKILPPSNLVSNENHKYIHIHIHPYICIYNARYQSHR